MKPLKKKTKDKKKGNKKRDDEGFLTIEAEASGPRYCARSSLLSVLCSCQARAYERKGVTELGEEEGRRVGGE